jgi:hypothetical protein
MHDAGRDYVVVLIGERVHPDRPLDIVDVDATVAGKQASDVPLVFVHALQDGPALDVFFGPDKIVDAVSFGLFGEGVLGPGDHVVNIRSHVDGSLVESFRVALSDTASGATPVVAAGYLYPPPGTTDRDFVLVAVGPDGTSVPAPIVTGTQLPAAAAVFEVHSVYPNPFSTNVTFEFGLPETAEVGLTVFDVMGRRVHQVTVGSMAAGPGRRITFDGNGLAAGVYTWRLQARTLTRNDVLSGKIVVAR